MACLSTKQSRSAKAAGKFIRLAAFIFAAGAMLSPSAFAYYHFVRYLNRTAPFTPIVEKFDVAALPNKTVQYYVSEQGPFPLAPNDTITGALSQIRLAARAWSEVETSELRLSYGGSDISGTGPGIDILFTDDLPPGILGQGFPTTVGEPAPGSNFAAITRAVVMLPRNMAEEPSYSEKFFGTAVHEIGHAIGLQHTLTSSAMSTRITRSVTKAKPLAADDIAGLSLLYPTPQFASSTGSIRGRVTMSGQPVILASVVAIIPGGATISTLTHPDGTYRLEGVPAGQYYLYVHPLPLPLEAEVTRANIRYPTGSDGRPIAPSADFETLFYPASKDPISTVQVVAGAASENLNFQVTARARPAIHSVQTYGFIGQVTTKPPAFNRNSGTALLAASGSGLMTNGSTLAAGLAVRPFGGSVNVTGIRPYPQAQFYAQIDLGLNPSAAEGYYPLIFSLQNDIHVLPSAFLLTQKAPPAISSVNAVIDGTVRAVAITGTNFQSDTRFLFDGQFGAVRAIDEGAGRAVVVPPPAPSGHRANVVALNPDGTSSLFSQGNNGVASYTYDAGEGLSLSITPQSLPAGAEAMVEVAVNGAGLVEGLARLAFSSPDIMVRRVWATAANRLVANVSVSASAQPSSSAVVVTNGLQTVSAGGFAITPATRQLGVILSSATPGIAAATLQAGTQAVVLINNLPAGVTAASLTATLNDQAIVVLAVINNQVLLQLPLGLNPGPAILRIRTASEAAPPIVLNIDPPAPLVLAIAANGGPLDAARPVRNGDVVSVTVANLVQDAFSVMVPLNRVSVQAGGIDHTVQQIASLGNGFYQITFTLGAREPVPVGNAALTVTQDGRVSSPQTIAIR